MILLNPYVHLTAAEMKYAAGIGLRRYNDVHQNHRPNRAELRGTDSEIANHLLGACGEAAFAKWIGIPYRGTVNTFHSGQDVLRYQIRCRRGDYSSLIVRDVDRDTDIFVLVTYNGERDRYTMRGWMMGYEAKQFEWRDDPRKRGAAYFVPQDQLRLMLTLPMEEDHVPLDQQDKQHLTRDRANDPDSDFLK